MPTRTEIAIGVWLDEDELSESFVRASGPGGQNVNKLSTAVELRLDVANSPSLPDWVKPRIATGRSASTAGSLARSRARSIPISTACTSASVHARGSRPTGEMT